MSAPTTDNAVVDFFNGLINILITQGESAAEAYITTLDPAILAIPLVAFFVDEGVQYLGGIVETVSKQAADALIIDIQTNGEEASVITTATALIYAQASGDVNAINTAKQNLIDSYGSLIHFDGLASAGSD